MTAIRLHPPVAVNPRLERLRLVPGRHLGEDEFDRLQAYVDERLAPLLAISRPGILHGLQVDPPERDPAAGTFSVRPGLAVSGQGRVVGLYYPTQATWRGLIEGYLRDTGADAATGAAGVHYLVLRRDEARVDSDQGLDPCRRGELDPRRDTRLVTLGTLGLRPLALDPTVAATLTQEQVQNRVAAEQVDGAFWQTLTDAVPLGLVSISVLSPAVNGLGYRVNWFSAAAGRYLAIPDSGYQALLAQTQTAFREALEQALTQDPNTGVDVLPVADYLEQNLRLDFLPAAGVLPSVLLEDPDARAPGRPRLRWLPAHLGVDMVPVPEEAVADLIERHLSRRVIDLRRPAGERIRLLLAVNEPDYRPDLLDVPQVDQRLLDDMHHYFMRAHDAWLTWRAEFDRLYALRDQDVLTAAQIRALDLPTPLTGPPLPGVFFSRLVTQARQELSPAFGPRPPYPYSDYTARLPTPPAAYQAWLLPPNTGTPPPVPAPADDGLVIRYRIRQVEMETVDNQIRALRARLEKTRDYVLLQRQQLDSQTVSLAALAGGVAGDGSGLQVARWLPFTNLRAAAEVPRTLAPGAADEPGAPAGVRAFTASFSGGQAVSQRQVADIALAANLRTESVQTFAVPQSFALTGIPASSVLIQSRATSVELGLQRSRLDRLKDVPKHTLTGPSIEGTSQKFGVLNQIRPEVPEYRSAYQGMQALLTTAGSLFTREEAEQIRGRLLAMGTMIAPAEVDSADAWGADWNDQTGAQVGSMDGAGRRYHALFRLGQILTRQIAFMEDRYNRIEDELEARLRDRIDLEGMLDKLSAQIAQAGQRLAGLDGRRSEYLGDYSVAQALTRDDWARVYRADQERSRVLTQGLRGLYYVRVHPSPISQALTDPLALRHGAAGDLVPGCDWTTEVDVPESLRVFFEAVLEVPMADWALLRPLQTRLPPPARLDDLWGQRRFRLGQRRTSQAIGTALAAQGRLATHLAPVLVQTQTVYQLWSAVTPPQAGGSLNRYYAETAQVLSLQDLLTGSSGEVQREAQTLHNRLEQCVVCLLKQLEQVQPSLRLDWAQRAEDDRLNVAEAATWPGLERAEQQDFNAVRTIAELTAWWFRQLDPEASANGQGALRAMLRATLIVAALGDPTEILQGQVIVPPRRFAIGEPVRLTLNRTAAPGTRLQLLDDSHRVVGVLRVDDQDDQGALARVERVDDGRATLSTRFTVVANRATQSWQQAQPEREVLTTAAAQRIRDETWTRAGLG